MKKSFSSALLLVFFKQHNFKFNRIFCMIDFSGSFVKNLVLHKNFQNKLFLMLKKEYANRTLLHQVSLTTQFLINEIIYT